MSEANTFRINEDSTISAFVKVGYYKKGVIHSFHLEGLKIDLNPKKIKINNRICLADSNTVKVDCSVLNNSYDGFQERGLAGWVKVNSINQDKGIVKLSMDITVDGAWRTEKKRYKGNYKLEKESR
ncbi:hypothetical protein RCC89_04730 [Cytophagaceae bacterium ABcell3]|nr:hypothetical protein RCC89_04730 [Cytophagaceae bacterium ABcell3]